MTEVVGDYGRDGYAHVKRLVPKEVARAMLASLRDDLGPGPIPLSRARNNSPLLRQPSFEIYGHHYKPMMTFLWGLTPMVAALTGKDLLPTYDYLRIYREGDICKVHLDRPACQHSLSLTLDYSNDRKWPLEIGHEVYGEPRAMAEDDFGDEPFTAIAMEAGDAVLYRGTNHRHGRITPNPNAWSVHLFLHWVERDGVYADQAFDRRQTDRVDFTFA